MSKLSGNIRRNSRPRRSALTIAELLAVLSVLSLLLVASVPAISSICSASARTRAVCELASLLEMARNEAMTRQCPAWLGIEQAEDSEGNDEIRAVVLVPEGGYVETMGSGSSVLIDNARAVSRTFRWKNLHLAPLAELSRLSPLRSGSGSTDPLSAQNEQTFLVGDSKSLSLLAVTFTPQGYAMLEPRPDLMTPYAGIVDIGLRPTRRGRDIDSADPVAVVLDGFSGHTEILRR